MVAVRPLRDARGGAGPFLRTARSERGARGVRVDHIPAYAGASRLRHGCCRPRRERVRLPAWSAFRHGAPQPSPPTHAPRHLSAAADDRGCVREFPPSARNRGSVPDSGSARGCATPGDLLPRSARPSLTRYPTVAGRSAHSSPAASTPSPTGATPRARHLPVTGPEELTARPSPARWDLRAGRGGAEWLRPFRAVRAALGPARRDSATYRRSEGCSPEEHSGWRSGCTVASWRRCWTSAAPRSGTGCERRHRAWLPHRR